jgi:hypothetical protein
MAYVTKDYHRAGREVDATGKIGGMAKPPAVEFMPPPGAKLQGEAGEALIKWRKGDDGTYCIVSVNGKPMPGEEMPKDDVGVQDDGQAEGDGEAAEAPDEGGDEPLPEFGG